MSSTFINYNGNILDASEPIFTTENRAFRYGDGLFESIRMIRGELPLLEMHASRLRAGMKALKLDGYQAMDAGQMEPAIGLLARSNKIRSEERSVGKGCYSTVRSRWLPCH